MYDFAVIGGGVIGTSTAIVLAKTGAKVILYDKKSICRKQSFPSYPISIRESNVKFLEEINLWNEIKNHVTPIKTLQVSAVERWGELRLRSSDYNKDALGYAVSIGNIAKPLFALAESSENLEQERKSTIESIERTGDGFICKSSISGKEKEVACRCIIAADGAKSRVAYYLQEEDNIEYKSFHCIIYRIRADLWSEHCAIQRFTEKGVYGLIPSEEKNSGYLFITFTSDTFNFWDKMSKQELEEKIQIDFSSRIGRIRLGEYLGIRESRFLIRPDNITPGILYLGDSRLSLPPIAAQGLNTAWQDISCLWELQKRSPWQDTNSIEWQKMLAEKIQPRHDFLYKNMGLCTGMISGEKGYTKLLESLFWGWAGIDSCLQDKVYEHGQGFAINEERL